MNQWSIWSLWSGPVAQWSDEVFFGSSWTSPFSLLAVWHSLIGTAHQSEGLLFPNRNSLKNIPANIIITIILVNIEIPII